MKRVLFAVTLAVVSQACVLTRPTQIDALAVATPVGPKPPPTQMQRVRFKGLKRAPMLLSHPEVVALTQNDYDRSMLMIKNVDAWMALELKTKFAEHGIALVDTTDCTLPSLSVSVQEFFAEATGSVAQPFVPFYYAQPDFFENAITAFDVRIAFPGLGETWRRRFVDASTTQKDRLPHHKDEWAALENSAKQAFDQAADSAHKLLLERGVPEQPSEPFETTPLTEGRRWRVSVFALPALQMRDLNVNRGSQVNSAYSLYAATYVPVTGIAEYQGVWLSGTYGIDVGDYGPIGRSTGYALSAGMRRDSSIQITFENMLYKTEYTDGAGRRRESVPLSEVRLTAGRLLQLGAHVAWSRFHQPLYRYIDNGLVATGLVDAKEVYYDLFFALTTPDPLQSGLAYYTGFDATFRGGFGARTASWAPTNLGGTNSTGDTSIAADVLLRLGYQWHRPLQELGSSSWHIKVGYDMRFMGGGNSPPGDGSNDTGDTLVAYSAFLQHGPYLYAGVVY